MIHRRFNNTPTGFKVFLKWVKSQAKKLYPNYLETSILFGLEHTGIYSLPLCQFLQKQELNFALQSGLDIKYSMGIRRAKNDVLDSKMIARYLYLYREEVKCYTVPSDKLMEMNPEASGLLAYRSRLSKAKKSFKVSAKELKNFSKQTVHQHVCSNTEDLTALIDEKIKLVEKQMLSILKSDAEFLRLHQLMTSVIGVGLIISCSLLVYTNGFTAFKNVRKLACYIGIAPFDYLSGSSVKKKTAISKKGHKKLKALLSNGVASAIQYDKQMKAYYDRRIAEGKEDGKVLNNLKFKLLARIFAVVKRGIPYVPLAQYKG